jgi:energy-coupling factor transport system permease protein
MRALFASRLPPGVAYLFAGPLLVVEQLKRQLAIIHEAQRARGVPLDESWYQRLRAMPALIVPLTHNALNDWPFAVQRSICGISPASHSHHAMGAARQHLTTSGPLRYGGSMAVETGIWIWLR